MARYRIFLQSLAYDERERVHQKFDEYGCIPSCYFGENGRMEFIDVSWRSKEDISTSIIFPVGCSFVKLLD